FPSRHDWSDGDCIKILKNVKKAMGTSSRILISEKKRSLLKHLNLCYQTTGRPVFDRQYTVDISMMAVLNAKERTLEDFITLGETAGLQFVKLWEAGELALVEFVPALRRADDEVVSDP
ncbi:hypothetical protein AGABI2DRAFT_67821, partial [Agaricus bisporus var. bisporus H97]|uniref:hypothetical protein n=1 Tax=Agaricus bisporus var. bisporus (strain H97 / ATCC MYA-4626 / FGSC 10389) TaxID=936046 RepID=UPI00029F537D